MTDKENGLKVKESEINPFGVARKPPKKKKRKIDKICFENPALNLEGPERPLNPFEVCFLLVFINVHLF